MPTTRLLLNLHRGDTIWRPVGEPSLGIKLDDHQIKSRFPPRCGFSYGLANYHLMMVRTVLGLGEAGRHRPLVLESSTRRRSSQKPGLTGKKVRASSMVMDVTVINDGSARLNALISGQIDTINRVDQAVALLSKTPRSRLCAPRRLVLGSRDGSRQAAIRSRSSHGGDARRRSRADAQGFVRRLRHCGQRPSDSADRPYFSKDCRSANMIRKPPSISRSGCLDRIILQASDAAFNGAVDRATSCRRARQPDQSRCEEGAGRRLLRQRRLQRPLSAAMGRTAGRDADARRRFQASCGTRRTGTTRNSAARDARAETDEAKRKLHLEMQAILNERGARSFPCSTTGSTHQPEGWRPHASWRL